MRYATSTSLSQFEIYPSLNSTLYLSLVEYVYSPVNGLLKTNQTT